MTTIVDFGEQPDALMRRLEMFALDRTFERYGNFVMPLSGEPFADARFTTARGLNCDAVQFWGNFAQVSAAFQINTDEPELILKLVAAIRANQQRADYLAQDMGRAA